jgi:hypothetical protein
LQTSSLTGTSDDQSLALLLGREFAAQGGSEDDNAALAGIGLALASSSAPDNGDVLTVDSALLQAAFATDPEATAALLTRTGAVFASVAGVVPGASAEPPVLFDDVAILAESLPETPPTALTVATDSTVRIEAPGNDDAFLQELLAETPRPALALAQALPPSVTQAASSFEAQRATSVTQANDEQALAPPVDEYGPAAAVTPERTAADEALAAQQAAREATTRFADALAEERAANERIASAQAAQRQSALTAIERDNSLVPAEIDEANGAGAQATQQQRIDTTVEQARADRAAEPNPTAAEELANPQRARVTAPIVQVTIPLSSPASDTVRLPPPPPVQDPQQIARDPAIASAIAAYNLSAGPFAALNGRREAGATPAKLVPAVESVTKVAAIDTDAATGESSRPFR